MLTTKIQFPSTGSRITMGPRGLVVPDKPQIPFIRGDGIGADISPVMRQVVDAAVARSYDGRRQIQWFEIFAGDRAKEVYGQDCSGLPTETIEALKSHFVSIKGPLGTPTGNGHRSYNVAMRKALDLFACVRPVRFFKGSPSPVKHPEKVDMVIFRENTEDTYAGIEWAHDSFTAKAFRLFLKIFGGYENLRFPKTTAFGIKPVSKEGSERLIREAIKYAIENGRKSVTIVHKGNIMKCTEGAFKKWAYELAQREFGDKVVTWEECQGNPGDKILIQDCIADTFFQEILMNPQNHEVIATLNLNGDFISDDLAATVGGLGIAPGANINFQTGAALFEATHGTAIKIAGKDIANPSSLILSAAMMLEYMGWTEAATLVIQSIEKAIENKTVTDDFAKLMEVATALKCSEFGNELLRLIEQAPS